MSWRTATYQSITAATTTGVSEEEIESDVEITELIFEMREGIDLSLPKHTHSMQLRVRVKKEIPNFADKELRQPKYDWLIVSRFEQKHADELRNNGYTPGRPFNANTTNRSLP